MRSTKLILALLLALAAFGAWADGGNVQVTTLPSITVADGRSTVTVSAYVRRPSGQPVPDGTTVIFSTTLGRFKDDTVVQTVNGVARAVLQTETVPGTAKITASALSVGAITTTEIEFLSDRSLLSSANEYVEIVAPGYMMFSMDQKILNAAGPGHGVKLRYREIEIEADDLQLNIPSYEVRAKKARLKFGKVDQEFSELYFRLAARKGNGTATINPTSPYNVTVAGGVLWIEPTHPRIGLTTIRSGGVTALSDEFEPAQFRFEDLSESTSLVSSKKAVVFPRKEVQFQKAEVLVGGVKVLKMPLFQVSLNSSSNVVTDSIFSVNNSQININYPYYLTLKPGQTSLLRFSTGNKYGRTSGVNQGLALDYELAWNRGDEFDGGLTLSSLTSRNWALSAHQYIRFDERSSGTAFFEVPQGKSLYGSVNYNRQFQGFGVNVNTSSSHSLTTNRFDSRQVSFVAERDPVKIGKLPFRYSYGLNASASTTQTSLNGNSQSIMGLHLRTQLIPRKLDSATQLNGYFTVGEQLGHNSINGLAFTGNATLSRQFGRNASGILTYDYTENGFNSGLTGKHQLTFSGNFHQGNFLSTVAANRALDLDKFSLFADLGYQLASLWRLSYSYTLDRYLGNTYVDYNAAIGYRLGYREIGLTFSGRTHRFGIQLLGAGFGG
jgi:hypothetical protein